ncbi:hypothetical protein D3C81_1640870 [compost metagenome]
MPARHHRVAPGAPERGADAYAGRRREARPGFELQVASGPDSPGYLQRAYPLRNRSARRRPTSAGGTSAVRHGWRRSGRIDHQPGVAGADGLPAGRPCRLAASSRLPRATRPADRLVASALRGLARTRTCGHPGEPPGRRWPGAALRRSPRRLGPCRSTTARLRCGHALHRPAALAHRAW